MVRQFDGFGFDLLYHHTVSNPFTTGTLTNGTQYGVTEKPGSARQNRNALLREVQFSSFPLIFEGHQVLQACKTFP